MSYLSDFVIESSFPTIQPIHGIASSSNLFKEPG